MFNSTETLDVLLNDGDMVVCRRLGALVVSVDVLQETLPFSCLLQPNASPATNLFHMAVCYLSGLTYIQNDTPRPPPRASEVAHVVLMDYGSLGSWGNVLQPHPTHFQPTRNLLLVRMKFSS